MQTSIGCYKVKISSAEFDYLVKYKPVFLNQCAEYGMEKSEDSVMFYGLPMNAVVNMKDYLTHIWE